MPIKKKIVWVVISCLMVLSLVIASCGPTEVEEEVEEEEEGQVIITEEKKPTEEAVEKEAEVEMVKLSLKKLDGTVVEKMVEKPKYGGVETIVLTREPAGFDDAYIMTVQVSSHVLTADQAVVGDFTRGPSGTGEFAMLLASEPRNNPYPCLAESWEWPDSNTIIFHFREGVHFALNPDSEASRLVNGREVTADDFVYSYKRTYLYNSGPQAMYCPFNGTIESMTAPDKQTVVVKCKPGWFSRVWLRVSSCTLIIPSEVVDKYGDMKDWRNNIGSGPFMLVNYVPGSSLSFDRNPNYWQKHPLFPEDTMPYPDSTKMLIIPDASTRQAALQTGKIDALSGLSIDDEKTLKNTAPRLKWREYAGPQVPTVMMRVDLEPFSDIRVRQALCMGIDRQPIKDDYYQGKAVIFNYPVPQEGLTPGWFIPLEDYPESTRETFEYHPDKAMQLLTEAGYPDGFKTTIMVRQADADLGSIVISNWATIGVEAELQVVEPSIWSSMTVGAKRTYPACALGGTNIDAPYEFYRVHSTGPENSGNIVDPIVDKYYEDDNLAFLHPEEEAKLIRESSLYINSKAWLVTLPTSYLFTAWQPWLKCFSGEANVALWRMGDQYIYSWIDKDLKKSLGY
jgi:peptide/nickel transport system substrate-binding protein